MVVCIILLVDNLRHERRVSPTKLPERLELVEALPITATGKVQKFELRDRVRKLIEAEQSSLAEPVSPRP